MECVHIFLVKPFRKQTVKASQGTQDGNGGKHLSGAVVSALALMVPSTAASGHSPGLRASVCLLV